MSRKRNPEYDKRDLLFAHTCEKCARTHRCTFATSMEGPEEVCHRLIEGGVYNCASCILYDKNRHCEFKCVFFVAKTPIVAVSGKLS